MQHFKPFDENDIYRLRVNVQDVFKWRWLQSTQEAKTSSNDLIAVQWRWRIDGDQKALLHVPKWFHSGHWCSSSAVTGIRQFTCPLLLSFVQFRIGTNWARIWRLAWLYASRCEARIETWQPFEMRLLQKEGGHCGVRSTTVQKELPFALWNQKWVFTRILRSGIPILCSALGLLPGNSRECPEKLCSRLFPAIFWGIFNDLWVKNSSISRSLGYFSLGLESNFAVEEDSIKAENHCNLPKECISFQKIGCYYTVIFS